MSLNKAGLASILLLIASLICLGFTFIFCTDRDGQIRFEPVHLVVLIVGGSCFVAFQTLGAKLIVRAKAFHEASRQPETSEPSEQKDNLT